MVLLLRSLQKVEQSFLDTITHIVLGACIGEAVAGRTLGKKAMAWGAFAHSVPDFDFISQLWVDPIDGLLSHRGFTHSITFGIIATLALSVIAIRLFPRQTLTRLRWLQLFSINIFAHIFLDTFNGYGTAWFEPFYHERISFHLLFVADPFFSIWPFIGFCMLLFMNRNHKQRRVAWLGGIGLSVIYLFYALFNKQVVDANVRKTLESKGLSLSSHDYIITPSPFNVWLWYIVAEDSNGYYTGYRSVFDRKEYTDLYYFPRNDGILDKVKNRDEVDDLLRFAADYYTVEKWHDTIVFNVPRFGQVAGWSDPRGKFVFYCFLDRPGSNQLIVQRGRFSGWNRKTILAFLKRIAGD